MRYLVIKLFSIYLLLLCCTSCKKFLDIGNPHDKIAADAVYSDNSNAASVLTGIYHDLQNNLSIAQGRTGISMIYGMTADEAVAMPGSPYVPIYQNNQYQNLWTPLYSFIYRINTALEGLSSTSSNALIPGVRQQLQGEARFLRAFCYFYLVNLYGDVPLLTKSDFKLNERAARSSQEAVYDQITTDLLEAQQLLSADYLDADAHSKSPAGDRVRPTKWAATALLARIYLYRGNWSSAVTQAGMVIDNKTLYDTVPLNEVFLMNSQEAIWQLFPVDDNGLYFNTLDGQVFVLKDIGPHGIRRPVWASTYLENAFEDGDQRKMNWLGMNDGDPYYYFYKYKRNELFVPASEYLMVLRLAEQYLIRAEANAQLNKIPEAQADLNVIRHRAGLNDTPSSAKDALLTAILHEREVELFMEWGHRWFDLKRTGKLNDIMNVVTPQKGGSWRAYKQVLPIPVGDLLANPNLKQNEGYPST